MTHNYKSDHITTTDLADFDASDLKSLEKLLRAYREQGLPEDFERNGVTAMMNKNSCNVFLTNAEYQVAMMNGDILESFYTCCNCGHEGFADECKLVEDGCTECCETEEEV